MISPRHIGSTLVTGTTLALEKQGRASRLDISGVACVTFILLAVALAAVAGRLAVAVYSLSFWHYYLYWLAYRFGRIALPAFERDALLMKSVALALFFWAYFQVPIDWPSLAIIAAGFALNAVAAVALGRDRTYYGHEVADLPWRPQRRFPYSWIAHPMLVGNIIAYGGTLLAADFRRHWWPLAAAHVAANLGLWAMERYVTPLRGRLDHSQRAASCTFIAIVFGVAALGLVAGRENRLVGATLGAGVVAFALVLFRTYTAPRAARTPIADFQPEENR